MKNNGFNGLRTTVALFGVLGATLMLSGCSSKEIYAGPNGVVYKKAAPGSCGPNQLNNSGLPAESVACLQASAIPSPDGTCRADLKVGFTCVTGSKTHCRYTPSGTTTTTAGHHECVSCVWGDCLPGAP